MPKLSELTSGGGGGVPIGALVDFHTSSPDVLEVDGMTFLRSGIIETDPSVYPDAPFRFQESTLEDTGYNITGMTPQSIDSNSKLLFALDPAASNAYYKDAVIGTGELQAWDHVDNIYSRSLLNNIPYTNLVRFSMSNDGKMLYAHYSNTQVFEQWQLSEPYNPLSAQWMPDAYKSPASSNLGAAATNGTYASFMTNADGTAGWYLHSVASSNDDEVLRSFTLTRPNDWTSAVDNNTDIDILATFGINPSGVECWTNPSGTKFYIRSGDTIHEFPLTTPFDLLTAQTNNEVQVTRPVNNSWMFHMTDDETFYCQQGYTLYRLSTKTPGVIADGFNVSGCRTSDIETPIDITSFVAYMPNRDGSTILFFTTVSPNYRYTISFKDPAIISTPWSIPANRQLNDTQSPAKSYISRVARSADETALYVINNSNQLCRSVETGAFSDTWDDSSFQYASIEHNSNMSSFNTFGGLVIRDNEGSVYFNKETGYYQYDMTTPADLSTLKFKYFVPRDPYSTYDDQASISPDGNYFIKITDRYYYWRFPLTTPWELDSMADEPDIYGKFSSPTNSYAGFAIDTNNRDFWTKDGNLLKRVKVLVGAGSYSQITDGTKHAYMRVK